MKPFCNDFIIKELRRITVFQRETLMKVDMNDFWDF